VGYRCLMVIRPICELTSVKDRALSTDDATLLTAEFIPQLPLF
jgi:hypothetical protein